MRGEIEIGGRTVDLRSIDCPVLSVIGEADHIVPPESTQPIMDVLPDVEELRFTAGHVGLIVGKSAQRTSIPGIAAWLLAQCDEERSRHEHRSPVRRRRRPRRRVLRAGARG